MRTWHGLVGLVLWLSGTAASNLATFGGIVTEPVALELADGTPICGTLYRSHLSDGARPGVVVLHGAALSHRSCAPGLSTPLARKGFVVLAIDLIGHGDSGGSRPRCEYGSLKDILATQADHPEVDAAIAYLQNHPLVDGRRLALVGHSRGGWAATNVARRRDDVQSVVSIGVAPAGCTAARPRNLFILTGDHDAFASEDVAGQALADATGGRLHRSHSVCGDFTAGTARRWVMLPGAFHLSALADPAVSRYATSWLGFSFQQRTGTLSGNRLLVAIFGAVVATLGGLLVCGWLLGRAATCILPPITCGEGDLASPLALWIVPLPVLGSLFLAAPLAAWLSAGFELGPLQFAVPALVLATSAGLLCFSLAVCIGQWLSRRGRMPATLASGGSWRTIIHGTGLGLLSLVLSIMALSLTWGSTWADLWPTPVRFCCGLLLFALLLPASWLLAKGVERATTNPTSLPRAHARSLCWLLLGVCIWLGFEWFVLDHWPLFTVPVWLLGMSLLVPLPLWLLPDRPGMTLARTFSHAAGAAWLLACHLPMVHGG